MALGLWLSGSSYYYPGLRSPIDKPPFELRLRASPRVCVPYSKRHASFPDTTDQRAPLRGLKTDLKGAEASGEDWPVTEVRKQKSERGWRGADEGKWYRALYAPLIHFAMKLFLAAP